MTLKEYEELLERFAIGQLDGTVRTAKPKRSKKKTRSGKKDPKMARALRKANSMMRTKSGKLRKGKTQADVMRKAHQLRRKM